MIEKTAIVQNSIIHHTAYIGHFCIIGGAPEKKGVYPHSPFGVTIGKDTHLTGHCTFDAGTVRNTKIGDNVFIMKAVHGGHDCDIEDDVTIACHSIIGGFVRICKGANLGLGVIVHPRQTIAPYCMIGAGAIVTKTAKIKPFEVWAGNPAKFIKMNDIGIEKAGLSKEDVERITKEWNDNL